MNHLSTSPHPRVLRRLVTLIALLAALPSTALAATKPAAQKRCVVHIQVGTRLQSVKHWVWVYRYVKIHGKRRRVVRHVRLPLYSSCPPPPCVKQRTVNGKLVPVTHRVMVRFRVPHRGKLVWIRRRIRLRVIVGCPRTSPPPPVGTPVTLKLESGSTATLDLVAFQREAPVSGSMHGYVVGGFHAAGPNQIILTGGSMQLGQTPIFIDDACNGEVSAAIRTGDPTTISLDPSRQSTSNVSADGHITSIVYTVIHLPLELRNGDDGCHQPYLSTGYDEERAALFLTGKLTGLAGIKLHAAPQDIPFAACLGIGDPTAPCNGFAIPIDVLMSTDLIVDINLGS